ncbi:serine hydrolase [Clostridium sp. JN-9]|uniref:serine hydrolase n=1 Tax=Clostridium sp. JN-9 TaxID=2507159 RepID=UPI000FFE28B5|nr:serine hydrolase [Clostridium sp. JN-9]QAT39556.1 serine hydrolase [Clostridium sp. JN-9]
MENIKRLIDENKGDIAVAFKNLKTNSSIMINEDVIFPSASTIKLVIIAALMNEINKGTMKLEQTITLSDIHKCGGDGILKELKEGHKFTLYEIAKLMIIISDNTAANILIKLLGMGNINQMAEKLGMANTKLNRKMMDSEAVKYGKENVTTAKDLCHFLELLYNGKVINKEYSEIILGVLLKQQLGGRLNLYLPEGVIIAHKTGDLDKLEHDAGIVYNYPNDYILCVLTKNLLSNKDGKEIIGRVSLEVYKYMNKDKYEQA